MVRRGGSWGGGGVHNVGPSVDPPHRTNTICSPPIVLPSFEVQVEPSEKFYYIDDPNGLTVNIIAR